MQLHVVCAGTPHYIFRLKNALVNLCTAPRSTPFAILQPRRSMFTERYELNICIQFSLVLTIIQEAQFHVQKRALGEIRTSIMEKRERIQLA